MILQMKNQIKTLLK